jgi:hypothetical protein
MFHPEDHPLERGWVGRVDGDRVIQLAAQTLQSFFLGGGRAREHAEYTLDAVTLLAPVQYPPTVRIFDAAERFRFANASAVVGPGTPVHPPARRLDGIARLAAVVGAEGAIAGFTALLEWVAPELPEAKRADFGLVLGPTVVTLDVADPGAFATVIRRAGDGDGTTAAAATAFDWEAARAFAERGTFLRAGDVLAGPPLGAAEDVSDGLEVDVEEIGTLVCPVAEAT